MRDGESGTGWGPSTTAIHLGYNPKSANGALTPPIYMTSTYAIEDTAAGDALFSGGEGYIYGRRHNPTQTILEERLAALEGAEAGLALASGMAAITAPMWTFLAEGDEVVIDHTLYGNAYAFFMQGLTRFGARVAKVDMTAPGALAAALTPRTRVVYFETPANPNLRVIDIAAVVRTVRDLAPEALVVVDNTFATPIVQRPLEHGADLVLHSATKFLSGHGDLLGGVLVGRKDRIERVRNEGLRYLTGATPF